MASQMLHIQCESAEHMRDVLNSAMIAWPKDGGRSMDWVSPTQHIEMWHRAEIQRLDVAPARRTMPRNRETYVVYARCEDGTIYLTWCGNWSEVRDESVRVFHTKAYAQYIAHDEGCSTWDRSYPHVRTIPARSQPTEA